MRAHEFDFGHQTRVEAVRELAQNGSVIIQNSRDTDKTTLLQSLAENTPLIDDKVFDHTLQQILHRDVSSKLFIDNLDALLTAGRHGPQCSLSTVFRTAHRVP